MRLLLVEDDQTLAEFVQGGFEEAGFSVRHEVSGTEGLYTALEHFFDVFVFDIMLPGLDGLTLVEKVRERGIKTPILILSAKQSVDDRVRGLQIGGDDYLVKPFSFTELLARVQALVRRAGNQAEHTHHEVADLVVDVVRRQVLRGGKEIELQNREFELLAYLIRNKGRVVSKTMIIENVWNFNFDPHTNIVEARISKLREKIDKDFDEKLIHTVRGAGYVLKQEQ